MKRRSLVWIPLPPLVWTCQKKKEKKNLTVGLSPIVQRYLLQVHRPSYLTPPHDVVSTGRVGSIPISPLYFSLRNSFVSRPPRTLFFIFALADQFLGLSRRFSSLRNIPWKLSTPHLNPFDLRRFFLAKSIPAHSYWYVKPITPLTLSSHIRTCTCVCIWI